MCLVSGKLGTYWHTLHFLLGKSAINVVVDFGDLVGGVDCYRGCLIFLNSGEARHDSEIPTLTLEF
jgi:hypothetical protein